MQLFAKSTLLQMATVDTQSPKKLKNCHLHDNIVALYAQKETGHQKLQNNIPIFPLVSVHEIQHTEKKRKTG